MKTEIFKDEGWKPMGAAFEVYYEQGCGLAERPQPAGLPEISRGLSASDTPGTRPEKKPHPGGVPELSTHHDPGPSPLIIARFWHPSRVQMIPAFQSGGIASLRSAQPPANFCEPSGSVSKSQSRAGRNDPDAHGSRRQSRRSGFDCDDAGAVQLYARQGGRSSAANRWSTGCPWARETRIDR